MTLYIIGIGLSDEKDITLKGLEAVKKAGSVYLESYTSILQCPIANLEKLYGKEIIPADRELIEKGADDILEKAKEEDVALLVIGDPMSATTHIDMMMRAEEKSIVVEVIHNASVLTAVGITGLQLYKFGKTTSIPFPERVRSETPYKVLKENKKNGMHTLILLDLDPLHSKFMTVNDAIKIMLGIERDKKQKAFTEETVVVGCARLGSQDFLIRFGKAKDIMEADFGKPPHCLIVPGELHFMEEDALKRFRKQNE